jgi:hypothetical protein
MKSIVENYTIPLLPKSIAVGLHDNLLQYLIELKYLLLFFERPVAVLSNSGFNFISEETIDAVRKNKKPRANAFDEINLLHLEVLSTEEWDEIIAQCEPLYQETNIIHTNSYPQTFPEENLIEKVDEIFKATDRTLGQVSTAKLFEMRSKKRKKGEIDKTFGAYLLRMEMLRFLTVLEKCRAQRIPMIWGVDTDLIIVNTYTKYLMKKFVQEHADKQFTTLMRMIKGKDLLKEIFNIEIVNLATVPVSKIVEFRKSNADLLESFLTAYRGFLVEVQNSPAESIQIAESRAQKILDEMDTIKKELLILRKEKEYQWLRRISIAAYDGAKNGAKASIWSLLLNIPLLAGTIGELLIKAATKLTEDLVNEREKENALLFRSSSGYLWKAHQEFRT